MDSNFTFATQQNFSCKQLKLSSCSRLWYVRFLRSIEASLLFCTKKNGKEEKKKAGFNPSHWIWHSRLIVWGSKEEVEAQTQQLWVKRRSVPQAQGWRGTEGRKGEKEAQKRKERDEKKKERAQAFLRTVFIESGSFRFISHYSWVLSQA